MSKRILIVESDTTLSAALREALDSRGFGVDETADGKGSVEQIRRDRPDLVVLAVDLSGGQNGYLICGKLKKDDDLKNVPIVIIGNPDGFAAHRKLKAHADEYVAKPVDTELLVERVGALIGFPDTVMGEVVENEGLTLDGLADEPMSEDEPIVSEEGAEEIAVEESASSSGEDLDMLDEAFNDMSDGGLSASEEPVVAPADTEGEEDLSSLDSLGMDTESALDSLGDDEQEEKTQIGFLSPVEPEPERPAPRAPPPAPPPRAATPVAPPPARAAPTAPVTSAADAAELRTLRARVAELQSALSDAQSQASSAEGRVQELESQLETQSAELETVRASAGKNDKDTFALRDAVNKKDKEILRLKSELNLREQEKDREISRLKAELSQKEHDFVELQDKQLELERQSTDSAAELARRDAQIKTLTTKADQLTADRKKVDQQLLAAKEEARGATSKLTALQAEVDAHQEQQSATQAELEELRGRSDQLEAAHQAAQGEADELRGQLEAAQQETNEVRAQLEQAQAELSSQAAQAADEAEGLRKRITELEEAAVRSEERVTKLYSRIKNDEKLRERAKKALGIAQQLLEEPASSLDADEAAA
ncbi:Response regulator receiver domain-containing protein [Stigmatella aurantiaca]|uniref:Response regulator receiver domain-containing protein n=1 Tax=Stigmatella aurantiaca TaxID=41 RepID=A0A1H7IWU7_STIAU|nr:response regulator [Stigmatella aurantiaca]SEK66432.1 Response regulator receiver domain-containing protein [Stigmatella aurantiaca]